VLRTIGFRAVAGSVALLSIVVLTAPASAATLAPVTDPYYGSTAAVYAAGAEANHVTLAGALGRMYFLNDPGVAITTPALQPPHVNADPSDWRPLLGEDESVYSSFNCVVPKGRGQGVCVATVGDRCNDSGCYFHGDVGFSLAHLSLGGGNDVATIVPGTGTVDIAAGAGDDTLNTRNDAVDWIDCGDGADTVAAEGRDNVAASCENVTRGRL
jgi:hypothetical protein